MSDYSRYYLKGVAGDYASAPQHYNDPRQTMPQTPPSSNSTPYTSSSNITLRSMQEEVMINNHIQELTMPPCFTFCPITGIATTDCFQSTYMATAIKRPGGTLVVLLFLALILVVLAARLL
ncbi:hypothetical protein K457DRAFT_20709 [Linnemannia elongata AG-77]|uniref:Uncharacterized protein n=1 Tax=Linnemannia elongata AG-77 TaxID=1314771 RepID=A0A197JTS8_9FUNG|nr:hypothetical protein K457DRAFT_20709 [Linnemannia elongata AG-77]